MLEILRQSLEYARLELTDIRFDMFVYLARDISDLFAGSIKNDEHILLGISSLSKLIDARVFLISEAFDSSIDFIQKNKIILGEHFLVLTLFLKEGDISHVFTFLAICVCLSSEFFELLV